MVGLRRFVCFQVRWTLSWYHFPFQEDNNKSTDYCMLSAHLVHTLVGDLCILSNLQINFVSWVLLSSFKDLETGVLNVFKSTKSVRTQFWLLGWMIL